MNYLGHLFISKTDPLFQCGVFMADFIKGNKYVNYPKKIQNGILFHRATDTFTDQSPILKNLKNRLYPSVGKYAGVVLDVYIDHVLAKNWDIFKNQPLTAFVKDTHLTLANNQHYLPWVAKYLFVKMFFGRWLISYKTFDGFENALYGMSLRPRVRQSLSPGGSVIKKNQKVFEVTCLEFLEEINAQKNTFSHYSTNINLTT